LFININVIYVYLIKEKFRYKINKYVKA